MAKRNRKPVVEILDPEPVHLELVKPELPTHGTLVAHSGAQKITRDDLALIETPARTETHQPIAHLSIVHAIQEALSFRHIRVVGEEFAVTPDGMKMFGLLELDEEMSGLRFALGIRNANDKSMRLGMVAGYRVFVCDNMSFSGEFKPILGKHTKHFSLDECLTIGIDRVQRYFVPLRAQIRLRQEKEITDDFARLAIYQAFMEHKFPIRMMGDVHKEWFRPSYEAFEPRTLWSLENAFTTAFKGLNPVKQYTETAKLGKYLAELN
jgi:hypothetical protein